MFNQLRQVILKSIEKRGRHLGVPRISFPSRKISIFGEDLYVANDPLQLITNTSGFYLPLPPNTFGVVIYPDGTLRNLAGGLYEAPPGVYSLQYVDKLERLDFTSPISEMTADGEKLTIKAIFRYRVVDPLTALKFEYPVETLIEHFESDIAQYIRTHYYADIVNGFENRIDSSPLKFFTDRHNQRFPLNRAFAITGVEFKDFSGDIEFIQRKKAELSKLAETQKIALFSRSVFGSPNTKYAYDLFVLMPFTPALKPVYDDHIRKVATEYKLTVARADDFFSQYSIMHEVWSAITQATIIIADCTGKNPNVFYEVGIAHTLGKPVILITQNQDDVPFDLRHIRYMLYECTPSGMAKFENSLTKTILEIMKDLGKNE